MSALADAVSAALVHSLWQDSIVAIALWAVLVSLSRRSATTRYAASCIALALMAGLPVVTAGVVYLHALPPDVVAPSTARAARAIVEYAPRVADIRNRPALVEISWMARLQPWALPLWSVGVLLFSVRLIYASAHVMTLTRRAKPADDALRATVARLGRRLGIGRSVRVVLSPLTDGPATIGWLRPLILLPSATALGITPQQLEALLAHELAHIRRHDYLVNLLQMALETLFFYHPAVWWASKRIRVERELCCDDIAVESCGSAFAYAKALTAVAQLRVTGLVVGSTGGSLLRRIQRLLGVSTGTTPSSPAWLTAAALVAILALVLTGARARGAEEQVLPRTTGGILGRIVDAQSGRPVPEASVEARVGNTVYHQLTRADGHYEFHGVVAGNYTVGARARGYIRTLFGQAVGPTTDQGPFTDGRVPSQVRLMGGEIVSRIDIQLDHSASMTGQVHADSGAELAGVEIELLRRMYGAGAARPVPVAFGQTEGPFSTFQISDVPPGEYYVRAYLSEPVRPSEGGPAAAYAPTFFPGVTQIADAQPIRVSAGQDVGTLNITLATVNTHVVSGRIVAPDDASLAGTRIELAPGGPGTRATRPVAVVARDGRFQIQGVLPGDYALRLQDDTNAGRRLGVHRTLNVNGNVTGLEIPAQWDAYVEGHFVSDTGGPLALNIDSAEIAMDDELQSGAGEVDGDVHVSRVQPDGTFSIEGPAGSASIRFRLPRRLPHLVVTSVRLDGVDVTDAPMDLRAGAHQRLEIVVSDRVAGLTGTVMDKSGEPVAYARVVAFPDERSRWNQARLIQPAFTQRDGKYELTDLPSGAYRAVAVKSLPLNAWNDPDVLEGLWSLATPVRLEEGRQRTLALKLSPTPQGLLEPSEAGGK